MQSILYPSDIAKRCGFSRQHVHHLFKLHGKPKPLLDDGRRSVYEEKDVARWLKKVMDGKYSDAFAASR